MGKFRRDVKAAEEKAGPGGHVTPEPNHVTGCSMGL